jgi:hypothetical protein
MTSHGTRWLAFIAILFALFLVALRAHGLDLNGPLYPFGCAKPILFDGILICPPSAGFSSSVQIDWIRMLDGDRINVSDWVWWNDSPRTVCVVDVGLVPEPAGVTAVIVLLLAAVGVRSRPP